MRQARATNPTELALRAEEVLRRNDMGEWTRAAPDLYPHQWSWDSGFIAIGLAHLDTARAARELTGLFAHQWKNGKVPHIVFNPAAPPDSYFPGAEHWASAGRFPDAPPAPPYTSALCQPPTHALGALRVWEVAREKGEEYAGRRFLRELYPRLLLWHRYLLTEQDPEGSGLVTIYHPWESGTDNSPRFDAALESVEVGELIKRARCDEAKIYEGHPFLVKDVLFSTILVAANEALLEIARVVSVPEEDLVLVGGWVERGRAGLDDLWDPELGLCLDRDLRHDASLRARTVAGFAPLIAGDLELARLEALLRTLYSPYFLGEPRLRLPLPPSTSPAQRRFHPRSYWRGPVWPVVSWLLWRSLLRAGESERAEAMRGAALRELAEGGFAEYFEPFTGEALGSHEQSWTAAVALDWLAHDGAS